MMKVLQGGTLNPSLRDRWQQYDDMLPLDISSLQRLMLQRAYYAGAVVMCEIVTEVCETVGLRDAVIREAWVRDSL